LHGPDLSILVSEFRRYEKRLNNHKASPIVLFDKCLHLPRQVLVFIEYELKKPGLADSR
jgi:hypothetical protein